MRPLAMLLTLLLASSETEADRSAQHESLCNTAPKTEMLAAEILDGNIRLGVPDCDMRSIVCQVRTRTAWEEATTALSEHISAEDCDGRIQTKGHLAGACRTRNRGFGGAFFGLDGLILGDVTYQTTLEYVDSLCRTDLALYVPPALALALEQLDAYAAQQVNETDRALTDDAPEARLPQESQ